MIDKKDYYHGAALMALMGSGKAVEVQAVGDAYLVNRRSLIIPKYSTKKHSPWSFSFSQVELQLLRSQPGAGPRKLYVLICGDDGICALDGVEADGLLGAQGMQLRVHRRHGGHYDVSGSAWSRKIPPGRWPAIEDVG